MQFKLSPLMAALAVAASAGFVPAVAQAQLSFNIGVVSLYKASGNDQDDRGGTNLRPALQGGVDYSFGNGFYVGNWNSTGKFGGGSGEIDLYAGYGGEITKGLSYDLNLATYIYPGNDADYNGTEFATTLSYGMFSAKYVYGLSDYTNKWVFGVKMPVSDALSVSAHYHVRNNNAGKSLVLAGNYDLGDGLSASATVSGTSGDAEAGKTRLVLGLSKSF
jgi:uncharacterized protein (TIGR02001 family)